MLSASVTAGLPVHAAGVKTALGDYEELAKSKDVDIVYVSNLHPAHKDTTILMLDNGKHVLCEKPLAVSCTLQYCSNLVPYSMPWSVLLLCATELNQAASSVVSKQLAQLSCLLFYCTYQLCQTPWREAAGPC